MSILDEYNHGSNGYHGYNSVIRHSEHPSHPCQHRVSGRARSPLRAAPGPSGSHGSASPTKWRVRDEGGWLGELSKILFAPSAIQRFNSSAI